MFFTRLLESGTRSSFRGIAIRSSPSSRPVQPPRRHESDEPLEGRIRLRSCDHFAARGGIRFIWFIWSFSCIWLLWFLWFRSTRNKIKQTNWIHPPGLTLLWFVLRDAYATFIHSYSSPYPLPPCLISRRSKKTLCTSYFWPALSKT